MDIKVWEIEKIATSSSKFKITKNHKDRVKNNKKVKAESDTMCLYYGKVSVSGV